MIFDEVFTGLWRLGATGGAALLGVSPDIACYAKLLTGGMVPLSATLATDAVFDAFQGALRVVGSEQGRCVWPAVPSARQGWLAARSSTSGRR